MPEKEIRELLKKYLEGRASAEEERLVDNWYESLSSSEEEQPLDLGRMELRRAYWNAIHSDIRRETVKTRHIWPRFLAVAASVVFILVITFYALPPQSKQEVVKAIIPGDGASRMENLTDKVMYVTLPDSSLVELLPKSKLTYNKNFNLTERKVTLAGEAFFEISHNAEKPFYVFTEEVVTRVLGTTFRVTAYPDSENIIVAVTTGRVSVYTQNREGADEADQNKFILTPNQRAVFTRSDHKVARTLVEAPQPVIAEGEVAKVRFEGAPVSEVFETLEKMYHIEIEFEKEVFAGCSITTSVTGEDMFERIDVICEIIGATYRVEDTRIVISGPGCN